MQEPRFVLLSRNPYDDISLLNGELDPLTEEEANHVISRKLSIARMAGRELETIYKYQVIGEPERIDEESLDGAQK